MSRVRQGKVRVEGFEPIGGLVVPPDGFPAAVPFFGVHGIKEENVNGFLSDFNGVKRVGNGHFFFMTENYRNLGVEEFARRFRASLGLNIGHSIQNRYSLDDAGGIVFESHPVVMLAIADPQISVYGDYAQPEIVSFWNPTDRNFSFSDSNTLSKKEDVVRGMFKVEPFVFDNKDIKELNLAWRDFGGGRVSSRRDASIFTEYYVYQKLASRILSRLGKEIESRKQQPRLPEVK